MSKMSVKEMLEELKTREKFEQIKANYEILYKVWKEMVEERLEE